MVEFNVGSVVGRAFGCLWRDRREFLHLAFPLAFLFALASLVVRSLSDDATVGVLVAAVGGFALQAQFSIAWFRFRLRPTEVTTVRAALTPTSRFARYILASMGIGLLSIFVMLLFFTITSFALVLFSPTVPSTLEDAGPEIMSGGGYVLLLPLALLANLFVSARFGLVWPAVALDNRDVSFAIALQASKPIGWRIMFALILGLLPVMMMNLWVGSILQGSYPYIASPETLEGVRALLYASLVNLVEFIFACCLLGVTAEVLATAYVLVLGTQAEDEHDAESAPNDRE